MSPPTWITRALAIADEAARVLSAAYRDAGVRVEHKGAIDLVTEVDLASERLLRSEMRAAFPSHALVAEEGARSDAASGDWAWFCDPLDGTTNFAHGHFFHGVSIGLARNVDGVFVPEGGVVVAPQLEVAWYGSRTGGAWRRDRSGSRPLRVSATTSLGRALVATGFPYDRATSPENNLREAMHIIPKVQGIRRCGAAALDLCLVADGTYDAYWEQKLQPWDLCAGAALVAAAGGRVTSYDGDAIWIGQDRVIASNGLVHAELQDAIRDARAER